MDITANLTEAGQAFSGLIAALSSIETEKFNAHPFEGSWTAGQLAQHVILSAGGFVELINGPTADTARDPEQGLAGIRKMFLDFSIKMKSPESIDPSDKPYDQQEQIVTLEGIKSAFLKAIETLDTTKTCTAFEIPQAGYMTRAEAITFTIVHTRRHLHQLEQIIRSLHK